MQKTVALRKMMMMLKKFNKESENGTHIRSEIRLHKKLRRELGKELQLLQFRIGPHFKGILFVTFNHVLWCLFTSLYHK